MGKFQSGRNGYILCQFPTSDIFSRPSSVRYVKLSVLTDDSNTAMHIFNYRAFASLYLFRFQGSVTKDV